MRVLIDTYNTAMQNLSGGVKTKIENYYINANKLENVEVTFYNKWKHKITDFDILHIFAANPESYSMILHAKNNNIPIIISSILALDNKNKILVSKLLGKIFSIKTNRYYVSKILELSDYIIPETILEKNFLIKNYGIEQQKIKVIPTGVNTNLLNGNESIIKEKLGLNQNIVLQVGRFDANKNQLNLIRAMKKSNLPVVFIGGYDKDNESYYNQCKKEATSNMFFLGWIDNTDPLLKSAYAYAKVVVLPSHKEIFGNVIFEGGLNNANLVVTNVLPLNDFGIEKYCKKINPNDINDIKEKIVQAYNEPTNSELSDYIYDNFSWDNIIKEHIKIYEYVLKK